MRSKRGSRAPGGPPCSSSTASPSSLTAGGTSCCRWRRPGYHVIAPDQRGYGRSGGTDVTFDDDLTPFSTLNRVRDMMTLINALGHRNVAMVVGHDFGSPVAGWCALTRPDVFRSVVMMSAPFGGAALLPFNTANQPVSPASPAPSPDDELAKLAPPRKHYQTYYTTREANENMWHPPQGVHNFLRAYYHMKSADWTPNKPFPLASNAASEQAKLPRYYVMDLDKGMAEQVASEMPTAAQIASNTWLTDEELKVYASEYGRNGFQGGLQSYRVGRVPRLSAELQLFAGRTIDVPSLFVSGKSDWGVYQNAGSLDAHATRLHEVRRRGAGRRRRSLGAAGTRRPRGRSSGRIRAKTRLNRARRHFLIQINSSDYAGTLLWLHGTRHRVPWRVKSHESAGGNCGTAAHTRMVRILDAEHSKR